MSSSSAMDLAFRLGRADGGAVSASGKNGGSIRNIVELPRGSNGLFKQPNWSSMSQKQISDYAIGMQKRRMSAAHLADYADPVTGLTNTVDPRGDYVCGGCNKRDNRGNGKRCLSVKIDHLDLNTGSCGKWEIECAGDSEHDNQVLTIEEAGYAVGTHPFGCARCTLQEPSGFTDEIGRSLWCGEWAVTVHPTLACCEKNNTPELELNKDGSVKDGKIIKRATGGAVSGLPETPKTVDKPHVGAIVSAVPGRTDKHKMSVPPGSYVINADTVSHLGENNTMAGLKRLQHLFGPDGPYAPKSSNAKHGKDEAIPVLTAGGEFVIAPEYVRMVGKGNINLGHKILDEFQKRARLDHIKTLQSLPGPAQS